MCLFTLCAFAHPERAPRNASPTLDTRIIITLCPNNTVITRTKQASHTTRAIRSKLPPTFGRPFGSGFLMEPNQTMIVHVVCSVSVEQGSIVSSAKGCSKMSCFLFSCCPCLSVSASRDKSMSVTEYVR